MYEEELELAKKAAIKAGEMLKMQREVVVDSAIGKDIKLAVDKASESIFFDYLKSSGIPILSEESDFGANVKGAGAKEPQRGLLWIIDPLDGTANYWKGIRELTCVSVALWKDDEPVLGVINRFECNELFFGKIGDGAWLNDKPIRTSGAENLSEAVLATGFPLKRSYESSSLADFLKQVQNFKKVRMLGTAAVMGAFVACGRLDAYMEESIMLWDIAASCAIVSAAGGVTEVERQDGFKCICRQFANEKLRTEFYDKCKGDGNRA